MDFSDADGTGNGNPAVKTRYLHGPFVDQVLAQEDAGGSVLWMLSDNQGTIRDMVNGAGVVQQHISYDSFGNIVDIRDAGNIGQADDALLTRYLYTGREYDNDTDAYYYRARWYDPRTGRFISKDPIGFAAGDANLYRYVGNGPTNATDAFGLKWENTPNWHHLVPQELRNIFGDSIDKAWNGWFLRAEDHSALHSAGWNKDWSNWAKDFATKNKRAPTVDDAKALMKVIMADPKYKCILDRGFKAGWSHAKWLDKSGHIKQKIGAWLAERLAKVTGKTIVKKSARGVLASIPIVSVGFSLYDYPARAQEYGTGAAVGLTLLDNVPLVDIAVAGAEGIDAVQQARLKAEYEAMQQQDLLVNELMREAHYAGAHCTDEE